EAYRPEMTFVTFDIKPYLYEELIIIEKSFRTAMDSVNWEDFSGKAVSVVCSVEAIIPQWVYMLITTKLKPLAASIAYGTEKEHLIKSWEKAIENADLSLYFDKKVAVKASEQIPDALYICVSTILAGKVATLLYGEPGLPKVIRKY
ncbi:MAG TPA: DUF2480 family protein, partial [Flavobacterium sp.]|nr:DUF2480 family protein [Flavobacterium sp.]